MDKFKHRNREVEVVRRPARRKSKNAPVSGETKDLPDGNGPWGSTFVELESTPWFSLDELKKRRFED